MKPCAHWDRCGATGHYWNEAGKLVRCPCMTKQINQRKLGTMFDENPRLNTPLTGKRDKDLRIEGPLAQVRPHVAGALLQQAAENKSFQVMDAYRLIEIFLEKDEEHETQQPLIETDLLVLLLGFGDPRNKYLPELMVQVLSRRELNRAPTWVLLGCELGSVSSRYSETLRTKLASFEKAGAR